MTKAALLADDEIQCPFCEQIIDVDPAANGDHLCPVCMRWFWILPMRLYLKKRPQMVYDRDGNPIGYQLPLAYLTYYTEEGYNQNAHDNHS